MRKLFLPPFSPIFLSFMLLLSGIGCCWLLKECSYSENMISADFDASQFIPFSVLPMVYLPVSGWSVIVWAALATILNCCSFEILFFVRFLWEWPCPLTVIIFCGRTFWGWYRVQFAKDWRMALRCTCYFCYFRAVFTTTNVLPRSADSAGWSWNHLFFDFWLICPGRLLLRDEWCWFNLWLFRSEVVQGWGYGVKSESHKCWASLRFAIRARKTGLACDVVKAVDDIEWSFYL